jgi:hypothetical protein
MVGKIASDREHDQILDLPGAMDIISYLNPRLFKEVAMKDGKELNLQDGFTKVKILNLYRRFAYPLHILHIYLLSFMVIWQNNFLEELK